MKKIKVFWYVSLIIALGLICPPSKGNAEPYNGANESGNVAGSIKTDGKKMLISPKHNCDPKMLIPGNPDIDPKFLVKLLPKK